MAERKCVRLSGITMTTSYSPVIASTIDETGSTMPIIELTRLPGSLCRDPRLLAQAWGRRWTAPPKLWAYGEAMRDALTVIGKAASKWSLSRARLDLQLTAIGDWRS